jgi:8-oxo-dGTP pyrophosphatase MutT (NUDIX family)
LIVTMAEDDALKASFAARPSPDGKVLRPRDAATLVIIDRSAGEPKVLMGKRRADLAFMAGKYVFPGGRMDPADKAVAVASDLREVETSKLLVRMRGTPSAVRARALAAAAIREAFEEAGLIIGARGAKAPKAPPDSWQHFFATGFAPSLAAMTFFARAITPPGRARRFDTRFFCIDASAIAERRDIVDGELSGLEWVTIEGARAFDLPRITRVVLEDLQDQLADGSLDAGRNPVPFYYSLNGSFKRDLITA